MGWQALLDPDIQAFITDNEKADVAALGLKKPPQPNWPYKDILEQIKARQKAREKIEPWLAQRGRIVLPPGSLIEQASSAATALYKARLLQGAVFADLTCGAGVDAWAFAQDFEKGICVEHDEIAAELFAHNVKCLALENIEIFCRAAQDFVKDMPLVDVVYLDPQRRTQDRKGLYRLEDCSPDVHGLLPSLRQKAKAAIIKTSPMLDIQKTLQDLEQVSQVHVVEWKGECKEVLYVLDFSSPPDKQDITFTAANIDDEGKTLHSMTFTNAEEKNAQAQYDRPQKFLYEPGPAFQKAGGFNMMAEKFSVFKLHPHTHLYTSDEYCKNFPGRHFEILDILPVDAKALKFEKANLSIRNFPMSAPDLKKKLKLKDGGDAYLFACTLENNRKVLLYCSKSPYA